MIFIWPSLAAFCFFSIFVFYQSLHLKNFNGRSKILGLFIGLSTCASSLTGVAYFGYYGWNVSWISALVGCLGSVFISAVLGSLLEKFTGVLVLSLGGFLGWPLCAYLMFYTLPK